MHIYTPHCVCIYVYKMEYSVQFSHSVVSNSLQPHELQHTKEWNNAICGEANLTKTNIIYYHLYMDSKINGTDEPSYKIETESQI